MRTDEDSAKRLLSSIDVSHRVGLRPAIIAMMVYTFGQVGAVVAMNVEDYYPNGKWCFRVGTRNFLGRLTALQFINYGK
jgi:hypothetical protein